ncbi:MAG: 4Fe-4S binding protein [Lachnospiraceae bacterium]|nr:4Fe-4S binding protein [Lachnospiraceae bacterium]
MIDKIGKACTGCYACVNACPKSCIHMKTDREGFWYPRFDPDQCIRCGRCVNACPVLSEIPNSKTEKDIRVYAVTYQDESIRMHSSSGGAFSALAETVLDQGGVVFGAAFTKNYDVHHIYV